MARKNPLLITDDLKINRGIVTKLKFFNVDDPRVIEIMFSLFAIPKRDMSPDEYESSIASIKKYCNMEFKRYVRSNGDVLQERMITDFNFTSANLRANYNKYVSFSIFVRQSGNIPTRRIKGIIRESLKEMSYNITKCFSDNGFSCSKNRR